MVLSRPVLDAGEKVVVLLNQGVEQGPVIGWQDVDEGGDRGRIRLVIMACESAAGILACIARGLEDLGLGVDGGNALVDEGGLAANHGILLVVEECQHFPILGQFLAETIDEVLELVHVGESDWAVFGSAGQREDSSRSSWRARPSVPEREIMSAVWLESMSR